MAKLADWKETIDLTPHSEEIKALAEVREKQKLGYKTSKQYSAAATNLTGLKGEFAFSLCTGLPVDKELKRSGDGGTDFTYKNISYDIKSSLYDGPNVSLLEFPDKRLLAHVFVLVQIKDWTARIIGWASRRQMRHASHKDYGHGPRLAMTRDEMAELDQDTIPPFVPSISTSKRVASQRSKYQLTHRDEILTLDKTEKLPASSYCFPHGPFEVRPGVEEWKEALYCKKCGTFYGYRRRRESLTER